jgi:Cu/Ag efflux protein CusF
MEGMLKWLCFLVFAIALAACGPKVDSKRYDMQGEIKALDPTTKSATISAGKIGDWMEAMTMQYPVKPDADFNKLHIGDHIQATVVVNDLKYYVTGITVAPK